MNIANKQNSRQTKTAKLPGTQVHQASLQWAAKNELSPPGLIIQGDVIIYHHYINAETDGEVLIVNTDHSSIPPAGDMSRHQSSNSPLVTSPWVMATHP
ncbi:hypothetical protein AVEN_71623-1, partial [Araneus ventricosus]